MPYEYLASVQSAVRRINDRIRTIAGKLGGESQLLQNYESLIDASLKGNVRFKNGIIQIHTPSKIYNDIEKQKILESLESSIKTWGEIRHDYEPSYDKYIENEDGDFMGDVVSIEEYINVTTELPQALVYLYSASDTPAGKDGLDIMGIKGRRKTYSELSEVIMDSKIAEREKLTQSAREKRYGVRKPARPRVNI